MEKDKSNHVLHKEDDFVETRIADSESSTQKRYDISSTLLSLGVEEAQPIHLGKRKCIHEEDEDDNQDSEHDINEKDVACVDDDDDNDDNDDYCHYVGTLPSPVKSGINNYSEIIPSPVGSNSNVSSFQYDAAHALDGMQRSYGRHV
jgi:hypothetical protein